MMFLKAAAVLIILYSIIQLGFEMLFFSQQLYMYLLDIATWVNVPLYILAIAFVSVFGRECLCPLEGQWQAGIVAVFLVWAHLILNMRRMRVLGETITKCLNVYYNKVPVTTIGDINDVLCRYWYLYLDVQEHFHSFLEANNPHSPTATDVCSDLLHDLQTISQSLCQLTICQSWSLNIEDHSYEHWRFGI